MAYATVRLANRYVEEARRYRLGRWGEERVADELRYVLDGKWTLFRNFEWPNRKWGDVDLILMGVGGVWAIEVKAYSGLVRNIGDRWELKVKRRWRRLSRDPGHQARRNAARLKEYLKNHGADVKWVEAVILWAGEAGSLSVEDPAVPVWRLDRLVESVDGLWQSRPLPEEVVQRATAVLEQAVAAAKNKD